MLNIVLPTMILLLVPKYVQPWTILRRYVPDVVLVMWVVVGTLYFGAVIKLIQSIVLVIRYKLHWGDGESEEETGDSEETD